MNKKHNRHKKHIAPTGNFYYLLASLVFLLFSNAVVDQYFVASNLAHSIVGAITIISMAISLGTFQTTEGGTLKKGLILVLSMVIITILIMLFDSSEFLFLQIILLLGFYLFILKIVSQQVLFSGDITTNNVIGSVCIYLLLGMIWVMLYILLSQLESGSFAGIQDKNWISSLADFTYFSFITLTTLGYGDILPITSTARFLVFMEAIVGVFYMAIVVSSLVGAALNNASNKKE